MILTDEVTSSTSLLDIMTAADNNGSPDSPRSKMGECSTQLFITIIMITIVTALIILPC